jgi:hypothetical protein
VTKSDYVTHHRILLAARQRNQAASFSFFAAGRGMRKHLSYRSTHWLGAHSDLKMAILSVSHRFSAISHG